MRRRRIGPLGPKTPIVRRLGALAAAVVLVGAAIFVAADTSSPGLVHDPAGPTSSAGPATVGVAKSAPPEEGWAPADLPPLQPLATIVASNTDRAGIAPTSTFELTSLTSVDAATLARGVSAEPAIAFAINAGSDRTRATLTPKAPLAAGVAYRLTLRTPEAALGGSWLFQTESPPRVVSTLPENEATGVPIDTGIEVRFDQDGVGPIAPFFSIAPKVKGTFERHGRSWAFVPEQLAMATIYTVTVRKGVTLAGSDEVLEKDFAFSFETAGPGKPSPDDPRLRPLDATFSKTILEVVPSEPPVAELYVERPWDDADTRKPLTSVDLRVYRLGGLPAAVSAYRVLSAAPQWAQSSDQRLVAIAGLPLVGSFTLRIRNVDQGQDNDPISYVEFPGSLDRGWYLVVRPRPGRDQQFLLQVTDVATSVTTTLTRSLLWVNDVSSGAPIEGATLWTAAGKAIAKTRSDGTAQPVIPPGNLFLVTAPDAGAPGVSTKPGRAAIVPLVVQTPSSGRCNYWEPANDYWVVLGTDRTLYRQTDAVNAWGMIRNREAGAVPANLELRVSAERWNCQETPAENAALAIVRVPVSTGGRTGTFATAVPIRDLAVGYYMLELWAGDTLVTTRGLEVGEITKPSYTFDVTTNRHVLVDGDVFSAEVTGQFFDGTRVPGLQVRLGGTDVGEHPKQLTTSVDGEVSLDLVASWNSATREDSQGRQVHVSPVLPEETYAPQQSIGYVVFPARLLLDGKALVDGDWIRITGGAHVLDQAAAERQWVATAGSRWEPKGVAAAGTAIEVRVMDRWYEAVRTGRSYDFITKRAYDTFRYDRKELVLAKSTLVARADGTFSLDVSRGTGPARSGHDYEVTLSGRDSDGRAVEASLYAYASWNGAFDGGPDPSTDMRFRFAEQPDVADYSVGAHISRVLTWRGGQPPTGGANRYLFFTAQQGLRDVTITSSPVFAHTFSMQDLPNISIGGVWFTGRGYMIPDGAYAGFERSDRELAVALSPDAARHAPGDTVRLGIRTSDMAGNPVAATVILRAIDEKLYAINAAYEEDPLGGLYQWVGSGIETRYASHPVPLGSLGRDTMGGGDTGGGGGDIARARDDFRDSVLFKRVTTGADGIGSVSFTLSDDITSWRVTGAAFTADFQVGQSSAAIAAGLPFFIEAPLAPEYLVSDRPTLLVRAYGTALTAGQPVAFTVSAPTIGMAPTTVRGPAFTHIPVALPALPIGEHAIRIEARAGSGTNGFSDTLVRTIHVVDSRFTQRRSATVVLPAALPAVRGTGMATYVFADAGRGHYLDVLQRLAWGGGDRVDQALAVLIARDVLKDTFGIEEDTASAYPSYLYLYQKGPGSTQQGNEGMGIALLPYDSPDLALSARVSLLAGERFDRWALRDYFTTTRDAATSTREQKNIALAGIAGLGGLESSAAADVVAALRDPALTVREQLYLALAAATLGDHATALAVERRLLNAYAQRLGPWLRLRVGSTQNDSLEATSLLALIAITVGDPIADAAEAYVEEHFTTEDIYQLQQAAFLRQAVARAPAQAARFTYTLAGTSTTVDLRPGETRSIRLTPSQATRLSARTLSGRLAVNVRWDAPVDPGTVRTDPSISLGRAISPASPVPAGSLITVTLTPTWTGDFTMTGCYRVVDLAPSGLLPVAWAWGTEMGSEDVHPWVISGQKVVFCAVPWGSARPPRLVYYARVVTPGTYAWEPAIMQSARASESAAMTPAGRVTLR